MCNSCAITSAFAKRNAHFHDVEDIPRCFELLDPANRLCALEDHAAMQDVSTGNRQVDCQHQVCNPRFRQAVQKPGLLAVEAEKTGEARSVKPQPSDNDQYSRWPMLPFPKAPETCTVPRPRVGFLIPPLTTMIDP